MRSLVLVVLFFSISLNTASAEERSQIDKAGEYAAIIMNHPEDEQSINLLKEIAANLENNYSTFTDEEKNNADEVSNVINELGI